MAAGLEGVRWETIHPALVHFTVGVTPVFVLAYLAAARARSERWTFAGDVALWIGTTLTAFTFAFGLVSNAKLFWPGGMDGWRWLHLGFGAASLASLIALSSVRAARHGRVAGGATAAAAFGVALLIGWTGWIGGEVLVFHAGMAVKGGAFGTLSPPLEGRSPSSFVEAMGQLRADVAAIQADLIRMTVEKPSEAKFDDAAKRARHLEAVAKWLMAHPRDEHAEKHPEAHGGEGANSLELEVPNYALFLVDNAHAIEEAAQARDLQRLSTETGRTVGACAGCHQSVRWVEPTP